MLRRAITSAPSPVPQRGLRILIEDPELVPADLALTHAAFDVTVCAGPCDGDVCPLVMDGACPLAPCDAVVTALDSPWARSVHAAWTRNGTPVVDARHLSATDPGERFTHHVGAALQRLWKPLTSEWQPGDR